MIDRRAILAAGMAMPWLGATKARGARPELTIIEARAIVTMEPARPRCRFAAIADGIVVALGDSLEELAPWTAGREIRLERALRDQVLLPGFIDPHVHPMLAAVMLNIPFIAPDAWKLPSGYAAGAPTPQLYRQRLADALAASHDDPFICWGYHELFHGRIGRADLDAMAPKRAVVLWQRSFHEIIVSSAMLERWGISNHQDFAAMLSAGGANPAHGDYTRGLFTETALPPALVRIQPVLLGNGRVARGMAALQQMMLRSGVTTASDMGTGIFADFATEAGLIKAAFERPDANARVMLMPLAGHLDRVDDLDRWMEQAAGYAGPHVRLDRRVKMLADGAFFALNMRMKPPGYIDGHHGFWLTEPAVLTSQFARYWNAGFSLHVHVNGDEGLEKVIEGLRPLARRGGQTITLEHLGYSSEQQNRQIADMGLMVSAQPNYIRVLGDAYGREGLGPGRAEAINRLGSLERKGVPLGLHSDFNMAPIDPLYLAWIAANRITIEGTVKAPSERLSLEKALRAVTIEAAQVIGMDHMVGSIAVGKKADFVVLDRDPHDAGARGLDRLKVAGVVFEGRFKPV